jgi:hypothetical protein
MQSRRCSHIGTEVGIGRRLIPGWRGSSSRGGTISYNARKYHISAVVQFAIPWSLSYIIGRRSETNTMAVLYSCFLSSDEYITPLLLPPPGLDPVIAMTRT